MNCKDYYWLYISASTCVTTGPQKWEKVLNLESIDWKTQFTNVGKTIISRENKLREFNFKLFHRLIVTKKELQELCKKELQELCTCGLNDDN